MNEEYYTFKDVILGLRSAYIENYRMLEQLKKYIRINGSNIGKLKMYVDDINRANRIVLNIIKEQNDISRILKHIFWQFGFASYNNSIYVLYNENNKLDFKKEFPGYKFNPKVEINNINEFEELAKEIMNSKFMTLPSVFKKINDVQGLSLSTYDIYLSGNADNAKSDYYLTYNPINDTVINDQSNKNGNDLIISALYTKIPKSIIPVGYREIIDASMKSCNRIYVDEMLSKGITELSMSVNEDAIVFKKRRVLHRYDD